MKKLLLPAALAAGFLLSVATPSFAVDNDADGFHTPDDCDDSNNQIHPGATELAGDSVDQDCDGDEICYVDADDDDTRSTSTSPSLDTDCFDALEGRASDPIDCNDSDSSISPLDPEQVGDDIDQDCDGSEFCYVDADDDGARHPFLTASSPDVSCAGPNEGYAADPIDCNDSSDSIHPGATEVVGNETDDDCDGEESCFVDSDGDGARSTATVASLDLDCDDTGEAAVGEPLDCDDDDGGAFPGGTEVCDTNDVDEDCDGTVDDDDTDVSAASTTPWYEDADDDGFGDASVSVTRCDPPSGYLGNDDDCDDSDASISPGDPEICDSSNVDEDCDGLADDDDTFVGGTTAWYADADADGYGDSAGSAQVQCEAPASHVGNDGDCDDTDDAIRPGGTETCAGDDPIDYNCDGLAACADPTCSSAPDCSVAVFDHLECFKIKTTEKLKATLDVDPGTHPPFVLAEGCTIGKAAKYCVPVMKTVAVVDASSTLVENPLYEGDPLANDRICYKVKCKDSPPVPEGTSIQARDRFGNRAFTKLKVSEICTPAEIVP
jgi:hypothetical protein